MLAAAQFIAEGFPAIRLQRGFGRHLMKPKQVLSYEAPRRIGSLVHQGASGSAVVVLGIDFITD
jgi:hypothetical protein